MSAETEGEAGQVAEAMVATETEGDTPAVPLEEDTPDLDLLEVETTTEEEVALVTEVVLETVLETVLEMGLETLDSEMTALTETLKKVGASDVERKVTLRETAPSSAETAEVVPEEAEVAITKAEEGPSPGVDLTLTGETLNVDLTLEAAAEAKADTPAATNREAATVVAEAADLAAEATQAAGEGASAEAPEEEILKATMTKN